MNLKALLAVFIIVGIGVMLLRTEGGMKYATQALDFLKVRVGNFVSGLFGMEGPWQKEGTGGFRIVMTVNKGAFFGQSYRIDGSSLAATGIVEGTIKIGDVELHKEKMAVVLELEGSKGTFEYTVASTIKFVGSVEKIVVDGNAYTSASGLKVSFEIVPIQFTLDSISERKITLESATGSIARLNPDGSIKSTEELVTERVEISKFFGFLRLEGSNVKLDGLAVSVKGTGEQSSFSW